MAALAADSHDWAPIGAEKIIEVVIAGTVHQGSILHAETDGTIIASNGGAGSVFAGIAVDSGVTGDTIRAYVGPTEINIKNGATTFTLAMVGDQMTSATDNLNDVGAETLNETTVGYCTKNISATEMNLMLADFGAAVGAP